MSHIQPTMWRSKKKDKEEDDDSGSDTISIKSEPPKSGWANFEPYGPGDFVIEKLSGAFKKLRTKDETKKPTSKNDLNPSSETATYSSAHSRVTAVINDDPNKISVVPSLPTEGAPTAPPDTLAPLWPNINVSNTTHGPGAQSGQQVARPTSSFHASGAVGNAGANAAKEDTAVDVETEADKLVNSNATVKGLMGLAQEVGEDMELILDMIQANTNSQHELQEELRVHEERRKLAQRQYELLEELKRKRMTEIVSAQAMAELAQHPEKLSLNIKDVIKNKLQKVIDEEREHTLRNLGVQNMTKELVTRITQPQANKDNIKKEDSGLRVAAGGHPGDSPTSSSSSDDDDEEIGRAHV